MLTRERLAERLQYDPETGKFYWRISRRSNVRPGKEAGGRIAIGYLNVPIDGKRYYLHRLAVLYMTATDAVGQVDHINGDRADNRWVNLRVCPASWQQRNMKKRKDGSSRFKGVVWSAWHKRWRAHLRVNKRYVYGGVHLTEDAAARAYDDLARQHFGEFARVNFPREGEQSAHDGNIPPSSGKAQ